MKLRIARTEWDLLGCPGTYGVGPYVGCPIIIKLHSRAWGLTPLAPFQPADHFWRIMLYIGVDQMSKTPIKGAVKQIFSDPHTCSALSTVSCHYQLSRSLTCGLLIVTTSCHFTMPLWQLGMMP